MSLWHTIFKNVGEAPLQIGAEVIRSSIPFRPAWLASDLRGEPQRDLYSYPDSPIAFAVVTENRQDDEPRDVVALYPWVRDGIFYDFELLDIFPDEDGSTGCLSVVSKMGFELSLLDPFYCYSALAHRPGQKFRYSIGGLAFVVEEVSEPDFQITEGPALEAERRKRLAADPTLDVSTVTSVSFSLAELRTLIPRETAGNYEFQTEIESVEEHVVLGIRFFKIMGLVNNDSEPPLRIPIFISDEILNGYVPTVGHLISGVLALQGHAVDEIRSDERWADAVEYNAKNASMEGFMRAFSANEYLSDLHPGAAAVAKAVIAADWDVIKYENEESDPDIPCFQAERADRKLDVWVRCWFEDKDEPVGFSEEERRDFTTASQREGNTALFVTVKCGESGEYYNFSYEGLEKLEAFTGSLMTIESQKKGGFADLSDETDTP